MKFFFSFNFELPKNDAKMWIWNESIKIQKCGQWHQYYTIDPMNLSSYWPENSHWPRSSPMEHVSCWLARRLFISSLGMDIRLRHPSLVSLFPYYSSSSSRASTVSSYQTVQSPSTLTEDIANALFFSRPTRDIDIQFWMQFIQFRCKVAKLHF